MSERLGGHTISAAWAFGVVIAMLTILSLLGVLPWATRAELHALKTDVATELMKTNIKLDKIDEKLDRVLGEHGTFQRRNP